MATRDQMISEAMSELKGGIKELGKKFDDFNKDMNTFKLEMVANKELNTFKEKYTADAKAQDDEITRLRTTVKIYAGIAGTLGAAAGAAIMKLVH